MDGDEEKMKVKKRKNIMHFAASGGVQLKETRHILVVWPDLFSLLNVLYIRLSANALKALAIYIISFVKRSHKRETMHNNTRQIIIFFYNFFSLQVPLLCREHYTDFKNVSIMNCLTSFSMFQSFMTIETLVFGLYV